MRPYQENLLIGIVMAFALAIRFTGFLIYLALRVLIVVLALILLFLFITHIR